MIKSMNGVNKRKCVFKLNKEDMTYSLDSSEVFDIEDDSLIVNMESMYMMKSNIISVELIGVGYGDNANAYKKYVIQERELKVTHDGLIKKERIDRVFIDRSNEYDTISTIILSILDNVK